MGSPPFVEVLVFSEVEAPPHAYPVAVGGSPLAGKKYGKTKRCNQYNGWMDGWQTFAAGPGATCFALVSCIQAL